MKIAIIHRDILADVEMLASILEALASEGITAVIPPDDKSIVELITNLGGQGPNPLLSDYSIGLSEDQFSTKLKDLVDEVMQKSPSLQDLKKGTGEHEWDCVVHLEPLQFTVMADSEEEALAVAQTSVECNGTQIAEVEAVQTNRNSKTHPTFYSYSVTASNAGWNVFVENGKPDLQAIDHANLFVDDEAAMRHVKHFAGKSGPYGEACRAALAIISGNHPLSKPNEGN